MTLGDDQKFSAREVAPAETDPGVAAAAEQLLKGLLKLWRGDTPTPATVAGDQATLRERDVETADDYKWYVVQKPSDLRSLTCDVLIRNSGDGSGTLAEIHSRILTSQVPDSDRAAPDPSSLDWEDRDESDVTTATNATRSVVFDSQCVAVAVGVKSASSGTPSVVQIDGGIQ